MDITINIRQSRIKNRNRSTIEKVEQMNNIKI